MAPGGSWPGVSGPGVVDSRPVRSILCEAALILRQTLHDAASGDGDTYPRLIDFRNSCQVGVACLGCSSCCGRAAEPGNRCGFAGIAATTTLHSRGAHRMLKSAAAFGTLLLTLFASCASVCALPDCGREQKPKLVDGTWELPPRIEVPFPCQDLLMFPPDFVLPAVELNVHSGTFSVFEGNLTVHDGLSPDGAVLAHFHVPSSAQLNVTVQAKSLFMTLVWHFASPKPGEPPSVLSLPGVDIAAKVLPDSPETGWPKRHVSRSHQTAHVILPLDESFAAAQRAGHGVPVTLEQLASLETCLSLRQPEFYFMHRPVSVESGFDAQGRDALDIVIADSNPKGEVTSVGDLVSQMDSFFLAIFLRTSCFSEHAGAGWGGQLAVQWNQPETLEFEYYEALELSASPTLDRPFPARFLQGSESSGHFLVSMAFWADGNSSQATVVSLPLLTLAVGRGGVYSLELDGDFITDASCQVVAYGGGKSLDEAPSTMRLPAGQILGASLHCALSHASMQRAREADPPLPFVVCAHFSSVSVLHCAAFSPAGLPAPEADEPSGPSMSKAKTGHSSSGSNILGPVWGALGGAFTVVLLSVGYAVSRRQQGGWQALPGTSQAAEGVELTIRTPAASSDEESEQQHSSLSHAGTSEADALKLCPPSQPQLASFPSTWESAPGIDIFGGALAPGLLEDVSSTAEQTTEVMKPLLMDIFDALHVVEVPQLERSSGTSVKLYFAVADEGGQVFGIEVSVAPLRQHLSVFVKGPTGSGCRWLGALLASRLGGLLLPQVVA